MTPKGPVKNSGTRSAAVRNLSIVHAMAGILFARALAALGGIVFSLLVANAYGFEALGSIAVFLSIAGISNIIGKAGADLSVTREVGRISEGNGPNALVSRLAFNAAIRLVAMPTSAVGVIACGLMLSGVFNGVGTAEAVLFLFFLPSFVVSSLYAGVLRGESRSAQAAVFELGSISAVATLILVPKLFFDWSLSPLLALVMAAALVAGFALWSIYGRAPSSYIEAQTKELTLRGSGFFMLSALAVFSLQTGAFAIVSPFLEAESLGKLRALERLSLLITFPMVAINAFIAPRAARLRDRADGRAVVRLWGISVLGTLGLSLPIALFLLAAPGIALGAFSVSPDVHLLTQLRAMTLATLFFATLAPAAMIASMIGLERRLAEVSVVILVIGIPAYSLAVLQFGSYGFVAVYCLVLVAQALRSSFVLWRQVYP